MVLVHWILRNQKSELQVWFCHLLGMKFRVRFLNSLTVFSIFLKMETTILMLIHALGYTGDVVCIDDDQWRSTVNYWTDVYFPNDQRLLLVRRESKQYRLWNRHWRTNLCKKENRTVICKFNLKIQHLTWKITAMPRNQPVNLSGRKESSFSYLWLVSLRHKIESFIFP